MTKSLLYMPCYTRHEQTCTKVCIKVPFCTHAVYRNNNSTFVIIALTFLGSALGNYDQLWQLPPRSSQG